MGAKKTILQIKLQIKKGSYGNITKNDSQTTQATLNCSESVVTNYNDMDCNYKTSKKKKKPILLKNKKNDIEQVNMTARY